jgi:hypothetical protein
VSDWKEALGPAPECIDIARLGEELDAAERTHLESCARCQTELALFREISRDESSPEEDRAAEWIAGELKRRRDVENVEKVVPFRPRSRVLYAVAAALAIVLGAGYWIQMREPSIDELVNVPTVYRSARLDVLAPIGGELAQAPNEIRWTAVPNASRYHVAIVEVDATPVWSADTTQTHIALPPAVIAQFAPGKSLSWDVKAFQGNEMLAVSETQRVRVSVKPLRKDP